MKFILPYLLVISTSLSMTAYAQESTLRAFAGRIELPAAGIYSPSNQELNINEQQQLILFYDNNNQPTTVSVTGENFSFNIPEDVFDEAEFIRSLIDLEGTRLISDQDLIIDDLSLDNEDRFRINIRLARYSDRYDNDRAILERLIRIDKEYVVALDLADRIMLYLLHDDAVRRFAINNYRSIALYKEAQNGGSDITDSDIHTTLQYLREPWLCDPLNINERIALLQSYGDAFAQSRVMSQYMDGEAVQFGDIATKLLEEASIYYYNAGFVSPMCTEYEYGPWVNHFSSEDLIQKIDIFRTLNYVYITLGDYSEAIHNSQTFLEHMIVPDGQSLVDYLETPEKIDNILNMIYYYGNSILRETNKLEMSDSDYISAMRSDASFRRIWSIYLSQMNRLEDIMPTSAGTDRSNSILYFHRLATQISGEVGY